MITILDWLVSDNGTSAGVVIVGVLLITIGYGKFKEWIETFEEQANGNR